ncbi:MAG TPA: alpha/beta hydrolase, partial [Acidimicrobiales bacterium]|nr:alpha/beta hydrolase [Acidimicrobiales bacterium]
MASLSSVCVDLVLQAARTVQPLTGVRTTQDAVDRRMRKPVRPEPRLIGKDVAVTRSCGQGMTCYTLAPSNHSGPSRCEVMYLHGGSYTFEISPVHYWFLAKLVRESQATVTVVIYPLAPESTAEHTVERVAALAHDLLDLHSTLVIAGDSAGGGLALAVTQQLVAAGATGVERLVLIAPWLDVTMSNPALDPVEDKDLMLSRAELIDAGRMYAGPLDPADPRVSPLNGEMKGLPPITLFAGTHDMLVADARALTHRARLVGVEVDYHEQHGMPHVYPLLPSKEGRAARAVLAQTLRGADTVLNGHHRPPPSPNVTTGDPARVPQPLGAVLEVAKFAAGHGLLPRPEKALEKPHGERLTRTPPAFMVRKGPAVDTTDVMVEGRDGLIPARSYMRRDTEPGSPGFLFIHGGGFVDGGVDFCDNVQRGLADRTGYVVVGLSYRLAPEHPFPAALHDCADVLGWMHDARPGGMDPARIAVGGESAGGNLTVALCVYARDNGGPAIAHQSIYYPFTDTSLASPDWDRDLMPGVDRRAGEL